MKKQGRPRQPRYVLSTEFDGERMFLQEINRTAVTTTTYHVPDIGMALQFTKYKADILRQDLSTQDRQYKVEPLHLS